MIEQPKPNGTTPFDMLEYNRMLGSAHVNAASMMQELVTTLQECDIALQEWRDLPISKRTEPEEVDLAVQVLKERQAISEAIDGLAEVMCSIFNLEA